MSNEAGHVASNCPEVMPPPTHVDASPCERIVDDANVSNPHLRSETLSVSDCVIRAFANAVECAGLPSQRVLCEIGLSRECLASSDTRIPASDFFKACEVALDLSADPMLGLKCAARFAASSFNLVSLLVSHASSLRQAIETLVRYGSLCSDCPELQLLEHEGKAILRSVSTIDQSVRVVRFVSEIWTSGLVQLIRHCTPGARIDHVCFAYDAPADRRLYTRAFDSAELFGQPFTGIVLDRVLLDTGAPNRDEELFATLQLLAEQRLRERRLRASCALRVREALLGAHGSGREPMEVIARSLQMSVRTLHRRLADEGRTYRALRNESCATNAKRLLLESNSSIHEIALRMGFCEATSFHRAFKRWTGMTPSAFRSRT